MIDYQGLCNKLIRSMFEGEATQLNEKLHKLGFNKDKISVNHKAYPCIHLPPYEFINQIEMLKKAEKELFLFNTPPKKFIDIGMGLGQKVCVASLITNLNCFGLELRPEFVKRAKQLGQNMVSYTVPIGLFVITQ